jgi:hypothetical protein
MQTILGKHLRERFPDIDIKEELFSEKHYWVNIRFGSDQWIVVDACSTGGFGLSIVRDGEIDFGGHDAEFSEIESVVAFVDEKLLRADSN